MNFLVKLSRNHKLMIPLVVFIGIGIFVGGAFVNNQQKVARQNETEQQINQVLEQADQIAQEEAATAENEVAPTEDLQDSADEGRTTDQHVAVTPSVTTNLDGTVTVAAKLDTNEPGTCITTIHETQFTALAKNGVCEFKDLSVPVDVEKLNITFEADNSNQAGSSSTRIE